MPVALVTQTMPLVALTPLLVLMLGRGTSVILAITISVTFFPAFVTMAQGLLMVPRAALEVPKAYGAVADVIFTPTRTIEVNAPHKPTCGIIWDRMDPHMYETIPPLQELKAMGL